MTTFAECMAWTAASLDRQIEKAIEDNGLFLADMGATDDEIAAYVAICREEGVRWKAEVLAEIGRGLMDWDAPTGKLQ
ncbi:hypothetical protein [Rhizobium beringeri]|uniref:hypothetical protein n=1 Tax=Rhizobium beringeri TaxID=3019934 RepID=UPI002E11D4E3|nr:hypothetical protein U8P75_02540 [Rhizobium beringeri]WSH80692.1 hypothetical protein U8P69_02515 [Rhizobium beringeri]